MGILAYKRPLPAVVTEGQAKRQLADPGPGESVFDEGGNREPPGQNRTKLPRRGVASAWPVETDRLAFEAGRMGKKLYASASSPLAGVVGR
jgi:hypothetical protein